ncbi:MAG: serine/threonine-protein kinase [Polyangiaceae bacterium]
MVGHLGPGRPTGSERLGGRFVLGPIAGSGAMGVVHRAYDELTGREVAVKVVKHAGIEGIQRFEREAAVLSRVAAPEVAGYVAHGRSADGQPYLAMEWLAGETLKARAARARLSFGETVAIATSVARALASAHAVGVVHRDIKPANVMIVGHVRADGAIPGTVKVLDFGVARLRGVGETLTETGAMIGTPAFMSPEQARGVKTIDGRSDLFSLGALLFWSLTGRPPFVEDDSIALLLRLTTDRAPHVRNVVPDAPEPLAQLIDALLEPDPAARPATARAVADALARIQASLGPAMDRLPTVLELERTVARTNSARPGLSTTRRAGSRHVYWMLPAAVAGGAAAAVALTLALRPADPKSPTRPRSSRSGSPVAPSDPRAPESPAPPQPPSPPPSSSATPPTAAGPVFPFRDRDGTFEAMFECEKPAAQAWPASTYEGMLVARELVQCDTKLGYATVSVTETLSGNLMACETALRVGEPMLLSNGGCTAESTEPFKAGKYLAQRELISCAKTKTYGEMRMYCDPARVAKGEGRFFVLWYMRFENLWNAPDADRFMSSFKPID